MMIPVKVAAKIGENPIRRRGKGSSTMFVSRGLVDPKTALNLSSRKGSRLIFLHHKGFAQCLTHQGRFCMFACMSKRLNLGRIAMMRTG